MLFDPSIWITSTSYTNSSAGVFTVAFEPSFEYFVARNVSLGMEIDLSYSNQKGYGADGSLVQTKRSLLGGGVHLGVNFPLSKAFSVYPLLQLGVHRSNQQESLLQGRSLSIAASPTGSPNYGVTGPWIELLLPVLYQPVPHFFLGVAPRVYHDFSHGQASASADAERTLLGVALLFGGFFDPGEASADHEAPDALLDETDAEQPQLASPRVRFGRRGTFLLTDGTSLSYTSTSYAGTAASQETVSVSPGVDWFFSDSHSFGGFATYAHSSVVGLATDNAGSAAPLTVTTKRDTIGVGARYGHVVSFSDSASFYPRLGLAYTHSNFSQVEGGARDEYPDNALTFSITLPVMIHFAPCLVIGFGPEFATDIFHYYRAGSPQVQATTVGLTTLLGGWL